MIDGADTNFLSGTSNTVTDLLGEARDWVKFLRSDNERLFLSLAAGTDPNDFSAECTTDEDETVELTIFLNREVLPQLIHSTHIGNDVIEQYDLHHSRVYRDFLSSISSTIRLELARIVHGDWFGEHLGFLEVDCVYSVGEKRKCERIVLSGPSVAIAPLFRGPDGLIYTILVEQPRMGCGTPTLECCAGFVDEGEDFKVAAAREFEEECGIHVEVEELVELGSGFIVPGRMTEEVTFYTLRRDVTGEFLAEVNERRLGIAAENEQIVVRVVPALEAQSGLLDASSFVALSMALNS